MRIALMILFSFIFFLTANLAILFLFLQQWLLFAVLLCLSIIVFRLQLFFEKRKS